MSAVLAITRSTALHCALQEYDIRRTAVLPGAAHAPMVDSGLRAA